MSLHKISPFKIASEISTEKGQTLVEYALLLLLIALLMAATIPGVTNALSNTYASIEATLPQ